MYDVDDTGGRRDYSTKEKKDFIKSMEGEKNCHTCKSYQQFDAPLPYCKKLHGFLSNNKGKTGCYGYEKKEEQKHEEKIL